MSEHTEISWTDATFNPWWGCSKVSPACDHCYAERDAKRFAAGRVLWGTGSERRVFDVATDAGAKHWKAPINWAKTMPAKLGRRPRVFCASMGDWLDLDAPLDEFVRLLDTIRLTPELDWLLLSKRIGNWRKRLHEVREWLYLVSMPPTNPDLFRWVNKWLTYDPPDNIWLGATIVDQAEADRDIPKLLAEPARVRFLSIEPMLGPVDLSVPWGGSRTNVLQGWSDAAYGVHWVIAGGESGPHARPAHPDWFRSLRDQCAAAGVPFHFKQWGEWAPMECLPGGDLGGQMRDGKAAIVHAPGNLEGFFRRGDALVGRLGKKAAGRLLDGVEHNGFPEAA